MIRSGRHPSVRAARALIAVCALSLAATTTEAAFVPRWVAEPDRAGEHFGFSIISAGDVNGDGFYDVLIGAPFASNGQANEGRVYLYYGTSTGPSGQPGWIGESNQAGALYGYAIAAVWDVDADGYDDIAVGAPLYDNNHTDEGAIFVYAGSDTGLVSTPWIRVGNSAGALFGAALDGPGDVDDDGYYDVLVGAPQYNNGQVREGRALVYRGRDDGLTSNPSWSVESNIPEAQFGHAVAFADLDYDFHADVIVGAPYFSGPWREEGRVSAYFGFTGGVRTTPAWSATGGRSGSRFGAAVAALEDANGDGYGDVLVGAPGYSGRIRGSGAAYLFFGTETGAEIVPAWTWTGDRPEAAFGRSVASLWYVNDDGNTDFAIGAPGYGIGDSAVGIRVRVLRPHAGRGPARARVPGARAAPRRRRARRRVRFRGGRGGRERRLPRRPARPARSCTRAASSPRASLAGSPTARSRRRCTRVHRPADSRSRSSRRTRHAVRFEVSFTLPTGASAKSRADRRLGPARGDPRSRGSRSRAASCANRARPAARSRHVLRAADPGRVSRRRTGRRRSLIPMPNRAAQGALANTGHVRAGAPESLTEDGGPDNFRPAPVVPTTAGPVALSSRG